MVEHVISVFTSGAARLQVSDIPLYQAEVRTDLERAGENFSKVGAMTGREVVDTDNFLPEPQKLLEEIGANEPGNPCDDPRLGRGEELFAKLPIRCGDHELAVEELPAGPIQGSSVREHLHPIMRAARRGFLPSRQGIFHSHHAAPHTIDKSCRDSVLRLPSKRSAK